MQHNNKSKVYGLKSTKIPTPKITKELSKKSNSPVVKLPRRTTTVVNKVRLPGSISKEKYRKLCSYSDYRLLRKTFKSSDSELIENDEFAYDKQFDELPETVETFTSSNFIQLIRTRLIDQCLSDKNSTEMLLSPMVELSLPVSLLDKRIKKAIAVSI